MQVDKICFTNFVDLALLAHFPWLISQPSVASTAIIYESSHEPLASWTGINQRKYNSWTSQKFFNKNMYIWLVIILFYFWNFLQNLPSWWSLGRNLLLSRAFFSGNPFNGGI
jgi:hypothetical protein